jgi:hypothetical protein
MGEDGPAVWYLVGVSGTCKEDLARYANDIARAGLGGQIYRIFRLLHLLSMRLCWEYIRRRECWVCKNAMMPGNLR